MRLLRAEVTDVLLLLFGCLHYPLLDGRSKAHSSVLILNGAGLTETFTTSEYITLVSSIASGVLAVVALALAIVFFVLSKKDADRSAQSSQQIAGSVDRLEKLFDTLYSDTFSMMRDTYTDMRKHVWRADPSAVDGLPLDADSPAELSPTDQTSEFLEKFAEVSAQIGVTDEKVEALQQKLEPILKQTLEAEAARRDDSPSLRSRAVQFLRANGGRNRQITFSRMAKVLEVDEGSLADVLFELARAGVVDWETAPNMLGLDDVLRYVPAVERGRQSQAVAIDRREAIARRLAERNSVADDRSEE